MVVFLQLLLSLLLFLPVFSETAYDGYKVYRIKPAIVEQVGEIAALQKYHVDFDFWTDLRNAGSETDIMVRPESQKYFEKLLRRLAIEHYTLIDNVRGLLENFSRKEETNEQQGSARLSFKQYHRFDAINNYLKDLAKANPKIASLETVGKSYEKRDIIALKVSSGGANKPAILVDGGIHAREWITPSTVLYLIEQLVTNKSHSDLYKSVDWYFIPVVNPDGYEYSHVKERLWRKTRSLGKKCDGVDANRNFDYKWGTIGASDDECSNNYKGKTPFSEPEILSLANFAKKYSKTLKLYINVHSYGQYLLYPWCYTNSSSTNGLQMDTAAKVAGEAIRKVNGTAYTVGYWYKTLYPSSGTSIDYLHATLKIPLTYTLELPDRGYGFVMPPELIEGVVKETFAGFVAFAKNVKLLFSGSNE